MNTKPTTMQLKSKHEVAALLYVVLGALVDAKSTPLEGYPNGHLYEMLMEKVDIDQWQKVVGFMKDSGLMTETNYLLTITPKGEALSNQLDRVFNQRN